MTNKCHVVIEDDYVYNVKYTVESGTEHSIEEKYIKNHTLNSNVMARRTNIQGRCG